MSVEGLKPGIKGVASTRVNSEKTAIKMKSGEVPVFATPSMVALMEEAAVQCIKDFLPEDQTSVGTYLEIKHIAATPEDMEVRAEAILEEIDGKRLIFKVIAFDEKEKIGEGTHERFIVNKDKFLKKTESKRHK